MIDYICSHEGIDPDVENLVDKLEAFTVEIDAINFSDFKNIHVGMVWVKPNPTQPKPRMGWVWCGFLIDQPNPKFSDWCG